MAKGGRQKAKGKGAKRKAQLAAPASSLAMAAATLEPTPTAVSHVLVVTAHPDDVDFGVAGTVAAWTKAGVEVHYCVVTNGEAGGSDLQMPRPEMARIRQEEQRAAAAEVGVTDVVFLGYPDGAVTVTHELRRDITRQIRRVRPERVLCQSPDRIWDRLPASHPDHLAAGAAAVSAVYPDCENPFAHPELLAEGFEPHNVSELWLMAAPEANRVVDVTDTFDRKMAALRAHRSQVADGDALEDRIRGWLSAQALAVGLPEGRLVESFRVVRVGIG